MLHHLDLLKKRQVKEDLIRPPKKRQEGQENRPAEAETPSKVKRVEMQKVEVKIEGENEENNKESETVGEYGGASVRYRSVRLLFSPVCLFSSFLPLLRNGRLV